MVPLMPGASCGTLDEDKECGSPKKRPLGESNRIPCSRPSFCQHNPKTYYWTIKFGIEKHAF